LLRRVEIATYHPHLGLLRPERCEGGHHTVYAGRREADVVMTSMFIRVNLRCAHQVRPPPGQVERNAAVRKPFATRQE
jgi:hypothetical protein